jgi:hypothetical protein
MSSKISLVNEQLHVEFESGEKQVIEDLSQVVTYEMFIEYLTQKADRDVKQYWKLYCCSDYDNDDKLDRYTFKGNVEMAILNAIPIAEEVTGDAWSYLETYIDEVSPDLIKEFMQDKSKNGNKHTLGCLRKFLLKQFIINASSDNRVMWLETTEKSPILI